MNEDVRMDAVAVNSCPDQSGIVAPVTGRLHETGANMLEASQHADPEKGVSIQGLHPSWPAACGG